MTTTTPHLNMTARELLVATAGDEHMLHTVTYKGKIHRGAITFVCSCGHTFEAKASSQNTQALRNVVETSA